LARDGLRPDSHGFETRNGQRGLRLSWPRHYRRAHRFGGAHHLYRSRRLPAGLWQALRKGISIRTVGGTMIWLRRLLFSSLLITFGSFTASAQTVQKLTLQEAENIALTNHPQIRAVRYSAL